VSSMRTGMVSGSRPPGSASPNSTSASAWPPSWPGYQSWTSAAAASAHGIATGEPAFTTTIVRGQAAATAATSSSCRPGSENESRSRPSVSQSSSRPTTTTAASASRAAATARSSASAGSGGAKPMRSPAGSPGRSWAKSTSISAEAPAPSGTATSISREPSPKKALPRSRDVHRSMASRPSTRRRARPALTSESRCGPGSRACSRARTRAANRPPGAIGAGGWSHRISPVGVASRRSGVSPGSSASNSSISTAPSRSAAPSAGRVRKHVGPRENESSTPAAAARSESPASGDTA
jgi:hypothetical protein